MMTNNKLPLLEAISKLLNDETQSKPVRTNCVWFLSNLLAEDDDHFQD
jgi:hypothetical protein